MKRKEELYLILGGKGQIKDKMVKCYECKGMGSDYESVPNYEGIGSITFFISPVNCKFCHGWGQVPLYAQEQLCTLK